MIVVAIVTSVTALSITSVRPSFADKSFPLKAEPGSVQILSWPQLYRLSKHSREAAVGELQALSGAWFHIPGYMLSYQAPDHDGNVSQFLLVPDPGTWIHPPHLDPGEVVVVRMLGGTKAPLLDRRSVWVEAQLSPSTVNRDNLEGVFELGARSVWELAQER